MTCDKEKTLISFLEKMMILAAATALLAGIIWLYNSSSTHISFPLMGKQFSCPTLSRYIVLFSLGLLCVCQFLRLLWVTFHFVRTREWVYVAIALFILIVLGYSFFIKSH